jgi:hypothetical protein
MQVLAGKIWTEFPRRNKLEVNRDSLYNILSIKRMTLDIIILIHFKKTILNNNC